MAFNAQIQVEAGVPQMTSQGHTVGTLDYLRQIANSPSVSPEGYQLKEHMKSMLLLLAAQESIINLLGQNHCLQTQLQEATSLYMTRQATVIASPPMTYQSSPSVLSAYNATLLPNTGYETDVLATRRRPPGAAKISSGTK